MFVNHRTVGDFAHLNARACEQVVFRNQTDREQKRVARDVFFLGQIGLSIRSDRRIVKPRHTRLAHHSRDCMAVFDENIVVIEALHDVAFKSA